MGVLDEPADGTSLDAPAALARPDDVVAALGRFLRRLHDSSPEPDTEVAGPVAFLTRARERVEAGAVAVEALDLPYRTHSPGRLLAIAAQLAERVAAPDRPTVDLVPIHGSLRVADLRIDGGEIVGWRRPDRALVGDPYCDLSFVARDLAPLIGPGAVPALFDATGIERPDPLRIELWVTLAQLL